MNKIFILMIFILVNLFASSQKSVILIKTMELDVINDRANSWINEMANLGFKAPENLDLVVLNANKNLGVGVKKLKAQIAKKRPDLIVSIATIGSQASYEVIKGTNIPMFFFFVADPVGAGLTKSVRGVSGSNMTGLVYSTNREKKIRTVREFLDSKYKNKMINIALIYSTYPSSIGEVREIMKVYKKVKNINFIPIGVEQLAMEKRAVMIEEILKKLNEKSKEIDYGWFSTGPLDLDDKIVKSIIKKSPIPILFTNTKAGVKNGAYLSIDADPIRDGMEAARISRDILNGKKTKDIELKPSTYFRFCANLKTSLDDGLIIPPNLLKLISKDCLYK